MHHPSRSFRFTSWLPGTILGIAIAAIVALLASPVTAGDKAAIGMKCKHSFDCESGMCKSGVCASSDGKKAANGAGCEHSYDCESHVCKDRVCRAH